MPVSRKPSYLDRSALREAQVFATFPCLPNGLENL
jgi:hypothetical protein